VDFSGLLLLGFMWLVVNAIRKANSKPPRPGGSPAPRPPRQPSRPLPARRGVDATQQEGLRLQDLLRDLGRTLDQASGPAGRRPDHRLPGAEEVEERESLEVAPEVRSLETTVRRQERAVVDQDDSAEQLVARRIEAGERRSGAQTRADHLAFDARIRQEPADATATPGYTARQLRDAMVWREILGPPVSMRDDDAR
jgi:hypothetical protein